MFKVPEEVLKECKDIIRDLATYSQSKVKMRDFAMEKRLNQARSMVRLLEDNYNV